MKDVIEHVAIVGAGVECISSDDMSYFREVVQQKIAADAIWNSWAGHLSRKYALTAGQDSIDSESGVITRGQADPS